MTNGGDEHDGKEPPLDPETLSLDDNRIRSLGNERFVVSAEGSEQSEPPEPDDDAEDAESIDPRLAKLDGLDGAYALTVAARTTQSEATFAVGSNDVSATFESFIRWYAKQISDDSAPEDVLAVLLRNSSLDVQIQR
ncbi:MAG: hypothetical protein U5K28_10455 [Halobacteriales archaeon]|nr:hypothetical protein [Halobacteriales archaeon]